MSKTAAEFERELDDLSPGTRETLIVAAHKDDPIWNDTMEAHSVDVATASDLRGYILKTYDKDGSKIS